MSQACPGLGQWEDFQRGLQLWQVWRVPFPATQSWDAFNLPGGDPILLPAVCKLFSCRKQTWNALWTYHEMGQFEVTVWRSSCSNSPSAEKNCRLELELTNSTNFPGLENLHFRMRLETLLGWFGTWVIPLWTATDPGSVAPGPWSRKKLSSPCCATGAIVLPAFWADRN